VTIGAGHGHADLGGHGAQYAGLLASAAAFVLIFPSPFLFLCPCCPDTKIKLVPRRIRNFRF
jgi:hypothetical protein